MDASKKNTPITKGSKQGNLYVSQHEGTENSGEINKIDLEIDFLQLKETTGTNYWITIFPKALQEIIIAVSNTLQFNIEYLGAGILSACSAAIGVTHKTFVKETWEEKSNLFMVIVGRPGDSKSHAMKFCYNPLHKKDQQYFSEYQQEFDLSESSKDEKRTKPVLKKYLISDFTPEALIAAHQSNKRGLTIYADELLSWLKNFNRYSNSGEAETYLSLWSGGPVSIDRATSKSIRIDDPFIGVIGGTQIGVLKEFAKEGRAVNGFMDRLLFIYPEQPKSIKWNSDKLDKRITQNYENIINTLIELPYSEPCDKISIHFSDDAQRALYTWQNNRPIEFLFEYERSIEIKLQQYVIRFALIIQMTHYACGEKKKDEIELFAIESAISLFHYFKSTALRVRREITHKNYLESLTLLQRTILEELSDNFTTAEGIKTACKLQNGKPRISKRQFMTYLNDKKLFQKIKHGYYKKRL